MVYPVTSQHIQGKPGQTETKSYLLGHGRIGCCGAFYCFWCSDISGLRLTPPEKSMDMRSAPINCVHDVSKFIKVIQNAARLDSDCASSLATGRFSVWYIQSQSGVEKEVPSMTHTSPMFWHDCGYLRYVVRTLLTILYSYSPMYLPALHL